MTLHDLITLTILPIGISGANEIQYMKYRSEYIPKLQIHQHSLLTRKVFSRHNLSAQIFFSVSFGSSSSHLHHQVIFIKSGSSLDLDHYWIIIIITASTISIKWCYLCILLIIGSSIKPTLFHVGCKPSLHVFLHLLQHLYLTMGGTHPSSMSERHAQHSHPLAW